MNYRKLGRYGIRVSEISLGNWLTQGRTLDDDTTSRIVRDAYDAGINLFDTADVYHGGKAETALGKAIQGIDRSTLVIATKCYFPMSDSPNDRGLGRKHITESVHASLRRLQTDYIDLFQFHRFDPETPIDETVRAIDDLVRQGKVLYWGVSQWEAHQIGDLVHTAKALNANPPASNQPLYNMLSKGIEPHIIPACAHHGLGMIVYSPLGQGVLTGKYLPNQPTPSGSRGADDSSNMFMKGWLNDEVLGRVQKLKAYSESLGSPLNHFALAWCLRKPEISSVIVGASSQEQLKSNVGASALQFPDDVWEKADAILEGRD